MFTLRNVYYSYVLLFCHKLLLSHVSTFAVELGTPNFSWFLGRVYSNLAQFLLLELLLFVIFVAFNYGNYVGEMLRVN